MREPSRILILEVLTSGKRSSVWFYSLEPLQIAAMSQGVQDVGVVFAWRNQTCSDKIPEWFKEISMLYVMNLELQLVAFLWQKI